jgi:hypothetical protein
MYRNNVKVSIIFMTFLTILFIADIIYAKGKPMIILHDAEFLGSSVTFNVEWQSPFPIINVKISMAGLQKNIEIDEYDNRRNQDGYWGESLLDIKLPANIYYDGNTLPYVIVIEDELGQKSDLMKGKVAVAKKSEKGKARDWDRGRNRDPSRALEDMIGRPSSGQERHDSYNENPAHHDQHNYYEDNSIYAPVMIDNSQTVNLIVEAIPTGVNRQRVFEIIMPPDDVPGEINWHVIDKDGVVVSPPKVIRPQGSNIFHTDPVIFNKGNYNFVVTPNSPEGNTRQSTVEFYIDDAE